MDYPRSYAVLADLAALEAARRGFATASVAFSYGASAGPEDDGAYVVMAWFGSGVPGSPLHKAAEAAIKWAVRTHPDDPRRITHVEVAACPVEEREAAVARVLAWFAAHLPNHVAPLTTALHGVPPESLSVEARALLDHALVAGSALLGSGEASLKVADELADAGLGEVEWCGGDIPIFHVFQVASSKAPAC